MLFYISYCEISTTKFLDNEADRFNFGYIALEVLSVFCLLNKIGIAMAQSRIGYMIRYIFSFEPEIRIDGYK